MSDRKLSLRSSRYTADGLLAKMKSIVLTNDQKNESEKVSDCLIEYVSKIKTPMDVSDGKLLAAFVHLDTQISHELGWTDDCITTCFPIFSKGVSVHKFIEQIKIVNTHGNSLVSHDYYRLMRKRRVYLLFKLVKFFGNELVQNIVDELGYTTGHSIQVLFYVSQIPCKDHYEYSELVDIFLNRLHTIIGDESNLYTIPDTIFTVICKNIPSTMPRYQSYASGVLLRLIDICHEYIYVDKNLFFQIPKESHDEFTKTLINIDTKTKLKLQLTTPNLLERLLILDLVNIVNGYHFQFWI